MLVDVPFMTFFRQFMCVSECVCVCRGGDFLFCIPVLKAFSVRLVYVGIIRPRITAIPITAMFLDDDSDTTLK